MGVGLVFTNHLKNGILITSYNDILYPSSIVSYNLVPHLRPLGYFFSPWLSNSLNDNLHMTLNSIFFCPIPSMKIDVLL